MERVLIIILCLCFSDEMHAELCYAECLLQKATLTFVQVREYITPFTRLKNLFSPVRFRFNPAVTPGFSPDIDISFVYSNPSLVLV